MDSLLTKQRFLSIDHAVEDPSHVGRMVLADVLGCAIRSPSVAQDVAGILWRRGGGCLESVLHMDEATIKDALSFNQSGIDGIEHRMRAVHDMLLASRNAIDALPSIESKPSQLDSWDLLTDYIIHNHQPNCLGKWGKCLLLDRRNCLLSVADLTFDPLVDTDELALLGIDSHASAMVLLMPRRTDLICDKCNDIRSVLKHGGIVLHDIIGLSEKAQGFIQLTSAHHSVPFSKSIKNDDILLRDSVSSEHSWKSLRNILTWSSASKHILSTPILSEESLNAEHLNSILSDPGSPRDNIAFRSAENVRRAVRHVYIERALGRDLGESDAWENFQTALMLDYKWSNTEHFGLYFVNDQQELIAGGVMNRGTIDHTPVYTNEVVAAALSTRRKWKRGHIGVVMYHNHPAGRTSPSKPDITMTEQLYKALEAYGISLLEHIIFARGISPEMIHSFAEERRLKGLTVPQAMAPSGTTPRFCASSPSL